MYTISVTNQKGGVGKTATTAQLGAALADLGYQVLLVDLDPQGHLTTGATGVRKAEPPATLAQAMTGEWHDPKALVVEWRPRLDVIPTNLDSFFLEKKLYLERRQEYRLQEVLEGLADGYDFCLIDAPPSLGILTDNALVAAQRVLIPVQALDSSLDALGLLIEQVRAVEKGLRISIDVLGLVVTMYDARRGLVVRSVLEALDGLPLDRLAVIHDRAVVNEAWRAHQPVNEYDPESQTADEFRQLAITVARRCAA